MMSRHGPDLALLLLAGFRAMVDGVTSELERRGHPNVRAGHAFAMRTIDSGADSAVELARRLSISKQAAAKTILALQARGYVSRKSDPADGRRKPLQVTPRGREMLTFGEAVFNDIRRQWEGQVGAEALRTVERSLFTLLGGFPDPLDAGAWLARTNNSQ